MVTPATMVEGHWLPVKGGDDRARALYLRHYSRQLADSLKGRADRLGSASRSFVGAGSRCVLLSQGCDALFVWLKRASTLDGQFGICCTVFRNESTVRSSDLIREAMDLAWRRWPGERLFTYVNPSMIRSTNPGACFKYAGWKTCGMSKGGLVILECLPEEATT